MRSSRPASPMRQRHWLGESSRNGGNSVIASLGRSATDNRPKLEHRPNHRELERA
jgi:hypothetical protein